jgi:hypothetical protein
MHMTVIVSVQLLPHWFVLHCRVEPYQLLPPIEYVNSAMRRG